MAPLRILHVVPYYEQAWAYGGIPRVATAVTQGLARRQHRVTVCTTDACDATSRLAIEPQSPTPSRSAMPDVHIFRNLSNALAYEWQLFMPLGLGRALRTLAPACDIAHLHACRNLPVTLAARALRRAGIPYVVSPNGTAPRIERRIGAKRMFDATVGRGFLDRAARVLAVSGAERAQLLALGIPAARVSLLPNPIDEREFDPPPDGRRFRRAHGIGSEPLVLFLGKRTPRKGTDVLCRAFSAVTVSGARLIIAGNDMNAGDGLDHLGPPTAGAAVSRVGLLRGGDRLEALAAADVVVYPSRDEVFGLVPIEALLCGTPVVVCSDSGAGELVSTLGGGHIVPYGDVEALAGAISAILRAPERWRQRARAAGTRARASFATDTVCARLDDIYRDVLASHLPTGPIAG